MIDLQELIRQARTARERARAPYSGYPVGAAVLTAGGSIHLGCNVESGAFSTTICAERVAIFAALAAGEHTFQALAVVSRDGATPCGACRQVIHEQCGEIPIHVVGDEDTSSAQFTTSQLLPNPFDFEQT
ncbi:MAG: cytidine deaminase [Candidatus Marinimicrobia bacterium]|nr:cytidine deaminase [Candidatus Neomarinimicrobiota bacterium]